MAGDRIRNIRHRVTHAFGVGFRWIEQFGGLLKIFLGRKDQNIKLLLAQRWRQAHHPFQTIRAHHARFLVGEIAAGEERRRRHVLIENQDVGREDAGLFVHFAGERYV